MGHICTSSPLTRHTFEQCLQKRARFKVRLNHCKKAMKIINCNDADEILDGYVLFGFIQVSA
jgi:hypothetical protein